MLRQISKAAAALSMLTLFISGLVLFNDAALAVNHKFKCAGIKGPTGQNRDMDCESDVPLYQSGDVKQGGNSKVEYLWWFFHDTAQHDKNIYYAEVDKIDIHLGKDFLKNVDLNSVQCDYTQRGSNCSGMAEFKGVTNEKHRAKVNFDKNRGVITYQYGVDGTYMPDAFGLSYKYHPKTSTGGYLDLRYDSNRAVPVGIQFESKDMKQPKWSAEAVACAYALVYKFNLPSDIDASKYTGKDFEGKSIQLFDGFNDMSWDGKDQGVKRPPQMTKNTWQKSAGPVCGKGYWRIDKTNNAAYYFQSFYLGRDLAWWKSTSPTPTPTPPPPAAKCSEMTLLKPSNGKITDPKANNILEIQTKDQFGRIWNGTYRYKTDSGKGEFTEGIFFNGSNPLTNKSKSMIFRGGVHSDTITIEDTQYPNDCKVKITTTPPPPKQCIQLTISPRGNINVSSLPYRKKVSVTSTFSNKGSYTEKYRWTVTPSNADVFIITPQNQFVKFYEGTESELEIYYNDTSKNATITVAEVSDQTRCVDYLKLAPPPICTALNMNPAGQKQLSANDLPFSQLINVSATYSGNVPNKKFEFTVSGDASAKIDNQRSVSGSTNSRTFTYNGSSAATLTVRESSNPQVCQNTYTVIPPKAQKCTNLTLSPVRGTVKTTSYPYTQKLKASTTFSNANGQNALYKWEAFGTATVNGKKSVEGSIDEVDFVAQNKGDRIVVTEITDPTNCREELIIDNPENICKNIKVTYNGKTSQEGLPKREFPYDIEIKIVEANAEYPNLPFSHQFIYRTPAGNTNPTPARSYTYTATGPGTIEVLDESNPLDCIDRIIIKPTTTPTPSVPPSLPPSSPPEDKCIDLNSDKSRIRKGKTENVTLSIRPPSFPAKYVLSSSTPDCATINGTTVGGLGKAYETTSTSLTVNGSKLCTVDVVTVDTRTNKVVENACATNFQFYEQTGPPDCSGLSINKTSFRRGETADITLSIDPSNFKGEYTFTADNATCVEFKDAANPSFVKAKTFTTRQKLVTVHAISDCSVTITTKDFERGTDEPNCRANFTIGGGGGGGGSRDCSDLYVNPTTGMKVGQSKDYTFKSDSAFSHLAIYKIETNENCAEITGKNLQNVFKKTLNGNIASYEYEPKSSNEEPTITVKAKNEQCSIKISTYDKRTKSPAPASRPQVCEEIININKDGGRVTPTPSPSPPSFEHEIKKTVARYVNNKPGDSRNSVAIGDDQAKVRYTIKYDITSTSYGNGPYTVLFDDTLGREEPQKQIPGGRIQLAGETAKSPNYIQYAGEFRASIPDGKGGFTRIAECGSELTQCYTGKIDTSKMGDDSRRVSTDKDADTLTFWDITFPGEKTIYFSYDGIVNWKDKELCNRDKISSPPTAREQCPGDKFPNVVRAVNMRNNINFIKDDAVVYVICPYILTRKGGDVFFEQGILSGIDVSCIDHRFKNSDGLVIIAQEKIKVKPLVSTGISNRTPSICDNVVRGTPPINLVNHFSSYICEISARILKDWDQKRIESYVGENQTRIGRFNETLKTQSETLPITSITQLEEKLSKDQPNQYNKVFRKEKGNVVIAGNVTQPCTSNAHNYSLKELCKSFVIPHGEKNDNAARTIIVENGDLIIKSNIIYEKAKDPVSNNRQRATIAFVVLNGDIIIDPSVNRLDGIYFAQDQKGEKKKGKLRALNEIGSSKQLVINGAVFGNIDPLAKKRTYIGSPDRDGGAIVIRYDENLLLNSPPGIEEFLNNDWKKNVRF